MNTAFLCILLLALFTLLPTSDAFSAHKVVTVHPVTTPSDIVALADLRYDEWILQPNQGDNDNNEYNPSRYAFRMATAELTAERSRATSFLAFLDSTYAVGAAELSPIEFEGAVDDPTFKSNILYVTDVVTSSKFRRMGIANALMDAVEQSAYDMNGEGTVLFLHVKPDNEAAKRFYANGKRGYSAPTADQLKGIRVDCLEENAGTTGQILLCKTVQGKTTKGRPQDRTRMGTGFGTKTKPVTKKSKWKKR